MNVWADAAIHARRGCQRSTNTLHVRGRIIPNQERYNEEHHHDHEEGREHIAHLVRPFLQGLDHYAPCNEDGCYREGEQLSDHAGSAPSTLVR